MTETKQPVVSKSAIEFSTWREHQDTDYERIDSEVVDYLNEFISYDAIDAIVEAEGADSVEWEKSLCDVSGISRDAELFNIARNHITTYITTQENNE